MKKVIFLFVVSIVLCSCDHASKDPENVLINGTQGEIFIEAFREGEEIMKLDLPANQSGYFCTCGAKLTSDSIVFQKSSGDSIVYHNTFIENSNFEITKSRSPYSEATWTEVDENQFEYTILPEDFP